MELAIIDEGADSLRTALGITDERMNELLAVFNTGAKENLGLREMCQRVASACVHANELWWCGMQIGSMYQRKAYELGESVQEDV